MDSRNQMDFIIIMKAACMSEASAIYEFAVVVLSELLVSGFLNKTNLLRIEPFKAVSKSLVPKRFEEDEETSLTRITAALSLLAHFSEMKIRWEHEWSDILLNYQGLDKIVDNLTSNTLWMRTTSTTIIAYLCGAGELLDEVSESILQ